MNKMIKDLDVFEAKLGSALRASGHLFPTTDREMEHFLDQTDPVTLPEKYQTPDFIFEEDVHVPMKRASITPPTPLRFPIMRMPSPAIRLLIRPKLPR